MNSQTIPLTEPEVRPLLLAIANQFKVFPQYSGPRFSHRHAHAQFVLEATALILAAANSGDNVIIADAMTYLRECVRRASDNGVMVWLNYDCDEISNTHAISVYLRQTEKVAA